MSTFRYYKRGQGELDTSNFPALLEEGRVKVSTLDEKTFVSLLALNEYAEDRKFILGGKPIEVVVEGYVQHLRGDKDVFPVASLYELLDHCVITTPSVQHESTRAITPGIVTLAQIAQDLKIGGWFTTPIGADASVPRICPEVQFFADKVRKDGKVEGLKLNFKRLPIATRQVIIVDDILGGGATASLTLEALRETGYTGAVYLWVAYNEGIHTGSFLSQFDSYFLGSKI